MTDKRPISYTYDLVIIGGGAAGFFTAINAAEKNPTLRIAILERAGDVLQKVRISGGGRCNVTHGIYDPHELVQYYPRAKKELLGPFHKFMCGDTMGWFEDRGVPLKVEEDGRVFPQTDSSQSIIDCFMELVKKYDIHVYTKTGVTAFRQEGKQWTSRTREAIFLSSSLVIACGSSPKMWGLLGDMGLDIIPAVPSLFTFHIKNKAMNALSGLAVNAAIQVDGMETDGPLLITHWGVSGPAVLKMSAWHARHFAACGYHFDLTINWTQTSSAQEVFDHFVALREKSKKQVINEVQYHLPKRLWQFLVHEAGLEVKKWSDCSNTDLTTLATKCCEDQRQVTGKSTFKEEFVTAGGVSLKEINFKNFSVKKFEGLYLAGEVLDIDALTGGFNFQNAWTGGYLIAQEVANEFA